ncbi:MAG TPA: glycosyltransferase family 4 protein [Kiritimatiellia bacterium]|nr:glycosyltransferase family 4 protein [Kiritimatiellia bacterium]
MNICVVLKSYRPDAMGGAERNAERLMLKFASAGHHVTLLAPRSRWSAPREEQCEGIHIQRVDSLLPLLGLARGIKRAVWNPRARENAPSSTATPRAHDALAGPVHCTVIRGFQRALTRMNPVPDILHIHETSWLAGVAAEWAASRTIPVICKEATQPPLLPIPEFIPNAGHWADWRLRCDLYVATTGPMRAALQENGLPADRTVLIPNGVPIPETAADPGLHRSVLCLANFHQGAEWKGFDTLIRAWSRVARTHPDAVLQFAGAGDAGSFRRLAETCGCADSVRFLAFQAQPESLYRSSAMLVLPSRREGLSNALLEAQSWGLPAVVSDIPGNRAVVEDGVNGIVTPVADEERLAAGISALLDDTDLRRRLGASGRVRIQREFSIDQVSAHWLDASTRLLRVRAARLDPAR